MLQKSTNDLNGRKVFSKAAILALGLGLTSIATPANAEKYLGEIFIMSSDYCPTGSVIADGQELSVGSNDVLYAILGDRYGGDSSHPDYTQWTFRVPNLQGKSPVGQGPGYWVGETVPETYGDLAPSQGQARVPGTVTMTYCMVTDGNFPARY